MYFLFFLFFNNSNLLLLKFDLVMDEHTRKFFYLKQKKRSKQKYFKDLYIAFVGF